MKLTESTLRQIIREEHEKILEEGMVQDALGWVKKKGVAGKEQFKKFLVGLKQELSETKEGVFLLRKIMRGEKLTPQEVEFVKEQAKDITLGTALLGLFILPGGAFLTAALVKVAKKLGIEITPSAFREEVELREEIRELDIWGGMDD